MDAQLDRIKELMREQNINASQLTRELGISSTSFTDWSRGRGSPSVAALVKFSTFFNVSLDYLVFGKNRPKPTVQNEDEFSGPMSPADIDLLTKYHRLPAEHQGKLDAFLDGMLAVVEKAEADNAKLSG